MSKADIPKLNLALKAEHYAIYGYGVVGARQTGPVRAQTTALWEAHRARRDQLAGLVTAEGGRPAASEPSYPMPAAKSPAALAALLEDAVLDGYVALSGASTGTLRRLAAQAMQEAMNRRVRWARAGTEEAFPGLNPSDVTPSSSP
ncbi:ferritin-like domain-containing protein [Actinocorallia longicatena]|uniref:Ferritin-like domain-containing protein n=1 Tax=Actinocorallia longicatena TaxID=111803 RepID=A0ABP6PXU3_9ACTN